MYKTRKIVLKQLVCYSLTEKIDRKKTVVKLRLQHAYKDSERNYNSKSFESKNELLYRKFMHNYFIQVFR